MRARKSWRGRVTRGPLAGRTLTAWATQWRYERTAFLELGNPYGTGIEVEKDRGWYVWSEADQVWLWKDDNDRA